MSSPNEAVVVLSHALDQAGDVLSAVRPQQLDRPTPCPDWTVGQLVGHLVAAPARFQQMMRGEDVDWSTPPAPAQGSWVADFRASADDLIHRWHQAGDAADAGSVDWQTAEFAVHTWDLARATGQTGRLDDEVARRGLAFMSSALTPENRGEAFGPEVTPSGGATAYDRLAAFAGRDPAWTPPS